MISDKNIDYHGEATLDRNFTLSVPTNIVLKDNAYLTAFPEHATGYSFQDFLSTKPPYSHLKHIKQLITGYHQIDICQPLSLGQSLLFYGKASTGKSKVAYEIAESFLKTPGHKVVISSSNPIKQKNFRSSIGYACDVSTSDVSSYFTPYIALAHAVYLRDQGNHVLFILDDLLFHAYKERSMFHPMRIVMIT